ncbi:hypothetical protein AB0F17_28125 [Nonomuraea sp. NPDC026600]|uniref:hypothetical protein n=1 Tax=Nonomuraea sp. NPDC026600 TaxID=3155363 RepID=UPI0033EF4B21
MARDENDRPYEDGQGRSLNPDLTGDVLSPRWSTDDTDEQPAIVVSGNETYILPPDRGAPELYTPHAEGQHRVESIEGDGPLYTGDAPSGALYGDSLYPGGDQLYTGDAPSGSVYTGDAPSGSLYTGDAASGPLYSGDAPLYTGDAPSGPLYTGDQPSDAYLPIDKSYESPYDDEEPEAPKRGFLGSGWTDDSSHGGGHQADGDREVRRRTKVLLMAAVAVVVLGAGAGWMLTGTSSDDPCAGAKCASAEQANRPAASPTESDASEDAEEPVADPTDTDTTEPTTSQSPRPTAAKVRATRTPTPRATRTRIGQPTAKPSSRTTRAPQETIKDTDTDTATSQPSAKQETSQPTQAVQTQAPAPAPTQSSKGLFDILFPWS